LSHNSRVALVWQIALAAYMQLISWVPLGKWNFQPCCPPGVTQLRAGTLRISDALVVLAFILPMLFFWVGLTRGWRLLMWIALIADATWLGLQIFTWWPPYLFGASTRWAAVYARAFAQATQVLPRWGTHLPPDAMHLVLQILLAGTLISGWRAVRHAI
jgi:hypothetical protein